MARDMSSSSSSSSSSSGSSTSTRTKSHSADPTTSSVNNLINLNKTRRLMRLIYSRIHPDLFTNYMQAQKQNENSLKILRNLLDLYASQYNQPGSYNSSRFFGSNLQSELIFFVKDPSDSESSFGQDTIW